MTAPQLAPAPPAPRPAAHHPVSAALAARDALAAQLLVEDSRPARLYRLLRRATETHEPCPTGLMMAAEIGVGAASSAQYHLQWLVEKGLVSVRCILGKRTITCTITGKSTAAAGLGNRISENAIRRARYRAGVEQRAALPPPPPRPVLASQPCWRCGTNPAHGCRHLPKEEFAHD